MSGPLSIKIKLRYPKLFSLVSSYRLNDRPLLTLGQLVRMSCTPVLAAAVKAKAARPKAMKDMITTVIMTTPQAPSGPSTSI